jgi:hypothetical protein
MNEHILIHEHSALVLKIKFIVFLSLKKILVNIFRSLKDPVYNKLLWFLSELQ